MPVEIRELQITAIVQDGKEQSSAITGTTGNTNTDAIVAQCVEQVLEILKQKNER